MRLDHFNLLLIDWVFVICRGGFETRPYIDIQFPGGNTGGETPVPIPNTEVKPSRADDTMVERPWESRSLPGL